jgi:hypothetical protein
VDKTILVAIGANNYLNMNRRGVKGEDFRYMSPDKAYQVKLGKKISVAIFFKGAQKNPI